MGKLLHEDIILDLIYYLDHDDVVALLLTCKTFYHCTSYPFVWQYLYQERYGNEDMKVIEFKDWKTLYVKRHGAEVCVFDHKIYRRRSQRTYSIKEYIRLDCKHPTNLIANDYVAPLQVTTLSGDIGEFWIRRSRPITHPDQLIKSYWCRTMTMLDYDEGQITCDKMYHYYSGSYRWPEYMGLQQFPFPTTLDIFKVTKLLNIRNLSCFLGIVAGTGLVVIRKSDLAVSIIEGTDNAIDLILLSFFPWINVDERMVMILTLEGSLLTSTIKDLTSNGIFGINEYKKIDNELDNLFELETIRGIAQSKKAKIMKIKAISEYRTNEFVVFSNQGHVIIEQLNFSRWPPTDNPDAFHDFDHIGCVDVCTSSDYYFALLNTGRVLIRPRRLTSRERGRGRLGELDLGGNIVYKVLYAKCGTPADSEDGHLIAIMTKDSDTDQATEVKLAGRHGLLRLIIKFYNRIKGRNKSR